jgi:DNA repair protein RecO (recombination protein O)
LHFLHRHDPQPEIFDAYTHTIEALVAAGDEIAACLRRFEIELLRQVGYALNLDREFGTNAPLVAEQHYEYRVDQGPVAVNKSQGPLVFTGEMLAAISAQQFDEPDVLRAANRLLRDVIRFHLGGKELKSRKVLLDMQRRQHS